MPRRRTTALGLLAASLLLGLALAGGAGAAKQRNRDVPTLVFPVAAPTTFTDDFGDPRSDGPPHPGNDLLAARKSPAVAAEAGTVTFWTTSATAGCMLYLHGDSGTTYEYIHLNNDVGKGNDNKGSCVPGTAYAPGLADGDRVEAGQPVGFVGDSGDANRLHPHLHFEVHPGGGEAVDPFPYLKRAQPLLFTEPDGARYSLVLDGTVLASDGGLLTLRVTRLREWPSHEHAAKLSTVLRLALPVESLAGAPEAATGAQVRVWTGAQPVTDDARAGRDGAIPVTRLLVSPPAATPR